MAFRSVTYFVMTEVFVFYRYRRYDVLESLSLKSLWYKDSN